MQKTTAFIVSATLVSLACSETPSEPAPVVAPDIARAAWGPETPNFNLQVVLRGQGFGLVEFRQPNDADLIIYLDTWVRDLAPNADYQLQRAVDATLDGACTSTAWLTLGQGLTPAMISTDATGTGRVSLWRSVAAFPIGSVFDIHFRVVDATTGAVVLQSACYEFTISL
jgi:hypothetical protein